MTSLPVPVSPVSSTGIDVGATRATCATTRRETALRVTSTSAVRRRRLRRLQFRRAVGRSAAPAPGVAERDRRRRRRASTASTAARVAETAAASPRATAGPPAGARGTRRALARAPRRSRSAVRTRSARRDPPASSTRRSASARRGPVPDDLHDVIIFMFITSIHESLFLRDAAANRREIGRLRPGPGRCTCLRSPAAEIGAGRHWKGGCQMTLFGCLLGWLGAPARSSLLAIALFVRWSAAGSSGPTSQGWSSRGSGRRSRRAASSRSTARRAIRRACCRPAGTSGCWRWRYKRRAGAGDVVEPGEIALVVAADGARDSVRARARQVRWRATTSRTPRRSCATAANADVSSRF